MIPSSKLWPVLILAALLPCTRAEAPNVEDILQKLVESSEHPAVIEQRNRIAYQRTSRVEYLNDDGTKKRDVIRVYKIAPEDGAPVTKLISVNGRTPKDKDDKNRSAARETGEKSRMLGLTDDIISRFDFTYVREEKFDSRPAWVLSFVPKADSPTESFLDRLINSMSGTFWIDKEDNQLAKADIRLGKRVSFFGGIAGAIDKLDLTLIQRRVEPSVWLGEAVHIDFSGRKLFSTIRFRCFENCGDFKVISEQRASAQ